ncbi:hypothetical protein [Halobacillus sp. Marseille-P3879]|nr:hypothetical protein [Halobacillus sp. Marseille-P3879]
MWIITTFSKEDIRMYEFQTKKEAVNFMKTIKVRKVLTYIE